jgi:tRNA1(Val) A37 N6-methylase TrmN6
MIKTKKENALSTIPESLRELFTKTNYEYMSYLKQHKKELFEISEKDKLRDRLNFVRLRAMASCKDLNIYSPELLKFTYFFDDIEDFTETYNTKKGNMTKIFDIDIDTLAKCTNVFNFVASYSYAFEAFFKKQLVYPINGYFNINDFPLKKIIDTYKQYFDNLSGKRVLDPCAGWGNRAISACLSDASEYVCCDPSKNSYTVVNNRLEHYKGLYDTKCTFINKPYEDVTDEELGGEFDVAICCPPYFDTEKYNGDDTSTNRYKQYDNWFANWYCPYIIDRTVERLKNGGKYFLTVGGLGGKLLQDTIEYLEQHCYNYEIIKKVKTGGVENKEATIVITK